MGYKQVPSPGQLGKSAVLDVVRAVILRWLDVNAPGVESATAKSPTQNAGHFAGYEYSGRHSCTRWTNPDASFSAAPFAYRMTACPGGSIHLASWVSPSIQG